MAKRKDIAAIKNPTIRKIKNRGFTPIKYHMDKLGGVHYGWIVREDAKTITIRLVGEEKNRKLKNKERKFITEL